MNLEEKRAEAIERVEMLYLVSEAVNAFSKDGEVYQLALGKLFAIDDEEVRERIRQFEVERNCLVYHVIFGGYRVCADGESPVFTAMQSLLYVSTFSNDWAFDHNCLVEGIPIAYVFNLANDELPEMGTIRIKSCDGALIRIL